MDLFHLNLFALHVLIICFIGWLTNEEPFLFISFSSPFFFPFFSISPICACIPPTHQTKRNEKILFPFYLIILFFFWYATACSVLGPSSVALLCKSNKSIAKIRVSLSQSTMPMTWWPWFQTNRKYTQRCILLNKYLLIGWFFFYLSLSRILSILFALLFKIDDWMILFGDWSFSSYPPRLPSFLNWSENELNDWLQLFGLILFDLMESLLSFFNNLLLSSDWDCFFKNLLFFLLHSSI